MVSSPGHATSLHFTAGTCGQLWLARNHKMAASLHQREMRSNSRRCSVHTDCSTTVPYKQRSAFENPDTFRNAWQWRA